MRGLLLGRLVGFGLFTSRVASADGDVDIARADALFAEGRALLESRPQIACEKFEQALALNPHSTGILLNAALCDEKAGRVARAAERFADAARLAREQNIACHGCAKLELDAAEEHVKKLVEQLPYLRISFTEELPDMRVVVDARVVTSDRLAQELPVDPGEHVVEVSAPGRVAYRTKVALRVREHLGVMIPKLASSVVRSSKKTIGVALVAGGGAATAGAVLLGVIASRRYDAQFGPGLCDRATLACSPDADAKVKSARTLGNVGTGLGIAGLVAVGVGGYLWLSAPKAERHRVAVLPHLAPDEAGLVAVGRF